MVVTGVVVTGVVVTGVVVTGVVVTGVHLAAIVGVGAAPGERGGEESEEKEEAGHGPRSRG